MELLTSDEVFEQGARSNFKVKRGQHEFLRLSNAALGEGPRSHPHGLCVDLLTEAVKTDFGRLSLFFFDELRNAVYSLTTPDTGPGTL